MDALTAFASRDRQGELMNEVCNIRCLRLAPTYLRNKIARVDNSSQSFPQLSASKQSLNDMLKLQGSTQ